MRATTHRWLSRLTEPFVLFPLFAMLLLGILWGTTLTLISKETAAARNHAAISTNELAETYEAQMVRALREIDLTLKLVKSAYEQAPGADALRDIEARELLPSNLLFAISVADAQGEVVASTAPAERTSVAGIDYFEAQRAGDAGLAVGRPSKGASSNEWQLRFSRRMQAADGRFIGVAILAVDAAYFVSGYEAAKLGEHGVLGVLGMDGVFQVRRSGDVVSAGDASSYMSILKGIDAEQAKAAVVVHPWDGIARYTRARQLYDFPLAVIVGLARDEQLAPAQQNRRTYLIWAAVASLAIVLFTGFLWRTGWLLARSRKRIVEEHIEHAERVEYLAYHDDLTGLPNRTLFSKLLNQGIVQARRHHRQLAVMYLDLDRFKHINDTLGHEAGDQLLKTVAARLKGCLRDTDCVARLGGDEFVVLLTELDHDKYLHIVAQKILAAVAKPFVLLGQEFRVTVSVGISTFPQDGMDEPSLKKNADIAMYQAKSEGKNNFQFYSEKLNHESLERLTLESSLRIALERDEFRLVYQPKSEIRGRRITGMEALLRWQHPELGLVAPDQFMAVAEESGLIIAIGTWVLNEACRQNVAWHKQGLPPMTVAVNLSPRQFIDEHLIEVVAAALRDSGMQPQLLELEIPESMLMQHVERTLSILAGLKALGVRLAIDDFGSGYSALAALQRFPLDTIKIDRSFIRGTNSPEDHALTEAIIMLGRSLSRKVVAQGVETKEQADFLRENACDEMQGFFFNHPLAVEEFSALVQAQMKANVLAHPAGRKKRA